MLKNCVYVSLYAFLCYDIQTIIIIKIQMYTYNKSLLLVFLCVCIISHMCAVVCWCLTSELLVLLKNFACTIWHLCLTFFLKYYFYKVFFVFFYLLLQKTWKPHLRKRNQNEFVHFCSFFQFLITIVCLFLSFLRKMFNFDAKAP